jgi:hypothetical protein
MYYINGFSYISEYDTEEDVRKIFHFVKKPNGEISHIPWSPYETMDESDFKLWIHLGMPKPRKATNFRKETLLEMLNEVGA